MALIIVLVNTSGLAEISNYRYEVMVGDGSPARSNIIETGVIEGHVRAEGWRVLAQKLIDHETVNRWNDPTRSAS